MNTETLQRVVNCVAATTRYPKQILTADAHIENDLGIDSVKRVEIVIALSAEFGLDLNSEQRDPSVQTIGDLVTWIEARIEIPMTEPSAATPEPMAATPEPMAATPKPMTNRFDPGMNGRNSQTQTHSPPHFNLAKGNPQAPVERLADYRSGQPLTGRVALVTGSGRGVGRVIARVLAARGATVLVNSFHSREQGEQTVSEIQAQGGKAIHLWGSVTNQQHVNDIFEQIEGQYGLDILVCNAAGNFICPTEELSWNGWRTVIEIDLNGTFNCCQAALPHLKESTDGGRIISISTTQADFGWPGAAHAAAAKSGIQNLMKTFQKFFF